MNNWSASVPTADSPLLVGLLVDVSGSMAMAMENRTGQSLNRLQAFEQSLGELAKKAKTISSRGQGSGAVKMFAYGFGFGNPFSVFFGSGASVRDLLSGATDSNSLISFDHLANDWKRYQEHVSSLAFEMLGTTPMVEGFETVIARFRDEEKRCSYCGKLLFVLSDGEPTDGNAEDVISKANSLKADGTLIISCYVTDQDITQPRTLYTELNRNWPSGAGLMFDCSSTLPDDSAFHAYLSEYNWTFQHNSKLFSQINQSEVLEEFLSLLISPLESRTNINGYQPRATVFISYSHKDTDWLELVRTHLKPLAREGLLDLWDDSRIGVSDDWRSKISKALESAKIAILLISADFLDSDFIANNELPPLLDAASKRGVVIVPVLVRSSRFEYTKELSCFQSLNPPSAPLNSLSKHEQERMLVRLSVEIERILRSASEKT
jgi:hypothetical protein